MSASTRAGRRAYTLVELVIVCLIMAILASVAAPKYREALIHYRVNAAAGRVAGDLRMIRQYARKNSKSQAVVFNATTNAYSAADMPKFDGVGTGYTVALLTSDYVADVISASFGGSTTITFDIYGRPAAAGTVVLQCGSTQKTVQVDDMGNVSIL
jgi:prepilin-type N-terminal cleavage/methylation domain-containing protein